MAYHTILVDLTADGPVEGRLQAARSLASRFDATLVGLYVTPRIELTPWQGGWSVYIPPEVAEAQRKANQTWSRSPSANRSPRSRTSSGWGSMMPSEMPLA